MMIFGIYEIEEFFVYGMLLAGSAHISEEFVHRFKQ
jgi:hypothetical protein